MVNLTNFTKNNLGKKLEPEPITRLSYKICRPNG